jgi:hypothetical protein
MAYVLFQICCVRNGGDLTMVMDLFRPDSFLSFEDLDYRHQVR